MDSDDEVLMICLIGAAQFVAISDIAEKEENSQRKQKKRNIWVKDWVQRREDNGCYAKLMQELRVEEPQLYKNFVRMSVSDFNHLLELVTQRIQKQDTSMRRSISAGERLALCLRFLATGDSFMSLQYLFRIPQSTISTIIPEVCSAIYEVLKNDYLKMPETENDWMEVAREFDSKWNFPHCIGAIDGKHVVMAAPPNSGSVYYNYKGTHSIVLMGIADANYRFSYIDVGANGRISDGGVFRNTSFAKALGENKLNLPSAVPLTPGGAAIPYMLVADDAFAMTQNVIKPYSMHNMTGMQRIFNYRLSRARRIVENCFGILASRFRIFYKPINLNPEKTKLITLACCALHNFLITKSKLYLTPGLVDRYDAEGNILPGEWRDEGSHNLLPLDNRRFFEDPSAKKIREELTKYFVDEGEIPFQYKNI